MTGIAPLYPMRFEPIYQYRLWGGRRLADLLATPLPGDGPIGEAWILSDREDHSSRVADGPLKGQIIAQLMEQSREELLGERGQRFRRFPLLLKFLDVQEMLSVQVHPTDSQTNMLPAGETGKTEAWVVLDARTESCIYAGLKPRTTESELRQALSNGTVAQHLKCFTPKHGDIVFLPAGTVHSLGDGVMAFEIQENSDVTFRLYDWNHKDPKTGNARPLQVEQALACVDFAKNGAGLMTPEATATTEREKLFDCKQFRVWRVQGHSPFTVGVADAARVLVCLEGAGHVEHDGALYAIRKGDAMILPAVVGACAFRPTGAVNVLEIALPE
jgi:mannose-6-phosphate isomerase